MDDMKKGAINPPNQDHMAAMARFIRHLIERESPSRPKKLRMMVGAEFEGIAGERLTLVAVGPVAGQQGQWVALRSNRGAIYIRRPDFLESLVRTRDQFRSFTVWLPEDCPEVPPYIYSYNVHEGGWYRDELGPLRVVAIGEWHDGKVIVGWRPDGEILCLSMARWKNRVKAIATAACYPDELTQKDLNVLKDLFPNEDPDPAE